MRPIRSTYLIGVVITLSTSVGCSSGPDAPFELPTMIRSDQESKLARFYTHEAAMLRGKAELLRGRAELYGRLFGAESEWVSGTLLLAEFYEDAAKERERLAGKHADQVDD